MKVSDQRENRKKEVIYFNPSSKETLVWIIGNPTFPLGVKWYVTMGATYFLLLLH